MKKVLFSSVLIGALSVGVMNASEDNNGAFLGLNLGGMITGSLGSKTALNSSVAVGLRGGYQAFFYDKVGARFYLSGIAAFGLLGANGGNNMSVNLSVMADLNGDMLFDFVNDDSFTTGAYLGFFGGTLIDSTIAGTKSKPTFATTVGINIGSRTTVNSHHEFDIGAKIGSAFNISNGSGNSSTKDVKAAIYVGASYSYKF